MSSNWRYVMVFGVLGACGSDPKGPSFNSQHPRIYIEQNRDRLAAALTANGPAAKRFKSIVDRWTGGSDVYNFSAWNAALVGQLTGDAKYCTAAIAAVDKQVTEAQAQISMGGAPMVAHDDYLYVGDFIGDLALVYDWCYDAIDGGKRSAWLAYADQAVWNIWNHMAAKWGDKTFEWNGWATEDPSDNYYYSFLRATMLLGLAAHDDTPDAANWLTEFHDTKLAGELVPTFEMDLVGGGSREGTGYGASQRGLFELYDFWAASTGETIATNTKHTRASMLAMMHQIVPTLDRFAPTGDQARDSTASLFDYHRSYLQILVSLFPADPVAPRAQQLLAECSVPQMTQQFMYVYDFLYGNDKVTPAGLDGMGTAYYAPGIGELYARSGWDTHATWVNLIAGPYSQSHAHQDQGALMIYKDGWLAYDAVVNSRSGLTQSLDSHGTVRIVDGGNTVAQKLNTASQMLALHKGTGFLHAAADITPVYKNAAAVQKVQREIIYLEPDAVVVYDRVASRAGSSQVWQLVSPAQPAINGTRTTFPASTGSGHTLSVERVAPANATASVHDFMTEVDFSGGFRLDETAPGGDNRFLHVLWVDGAIGTVTPGTDGATLTVGGKTVVVQFNHDTVGGSISIDGSSTTLGGGVDTLPE
jgi:hypothetical protein